MTEAERQAKAANTGYGANIPLAPGSTKPKLKSAGGMSPRLAGPPATIGKVMTAPRPAQSDSPVASTPPAGNPTLSLQPVNPSPRGQNVKLTFEIEGMIQWTIECSNLCLSEDRRKLVLEFPGQGIVPLRILDLAHLPTVYVAAEGGRAFTLAPSEKPTAFPFQDKILYLLPLAAPEPEVEEETEVTNNDPEIDALLDGDDDRGFEPLFTKTTEVVQTAPKASLADVLSRFGQPNLDT